MVMSEISVSFHDSFTLLLRFASPLHPLAVPRAVTGTCQPLDMQCQNVMGQTVCGQYTEAAHSFSGSSITLGLYTLPEIEWSATCPVSRDSFAKSHVPLLRAIKGLMAVMIVSVIAGFVGGILSPIYEYLKDQGHYPRVEVHDQPEFEDGVKVPLLFCKVIPVIAALILLGAVNNIFQRLGKSFNCSDPTTNKSVRLLATKLPSSFTSSTVNIVVDFLSLLYAIHVLRQKVNIYNKHMKNTVADQYGRRVVRISLDADGGDQTMEIFCKIYKFTAPHDIPGGTDVFVYQDGEVWDSLTGRDDTYKQQTFQARPMWGLGGIQIPMQSYVAVPVSPQQPAGQVMMVPQAQLQPQIMQPQVYVQPHTQPQMYAQPQTIQHQGYVQPQTQTQMYVQPQAQPQMYVQPQTQPQAFSQPQAVGQTQMYVQPQAQPQAFSQPQAFGQTQMYVQPQAQPQMYVQPQTQPQAFSQPQAFGQTQIYVQPQAQPQMGQSQPQVYGQPYMGQPQIQTPVTGHTHF